MAERWAGFARVSAGGAIWQPPRMRMMPVPPPGDPEFVDWSGPRDGYLQICYVGWDRHRVEQATRWRMCMERARRP